MYVRLSRDDERAGESLSIENQKAILSDYIAEQGWTLYDTYVDDGISGTTFERPGVKRLLDDAKQGVINTILVKDRAVSEEITLWSDSISITFFPRSAYVSWRYRTISIQRIKTLPLWI